MRKLNLIALTLALGSLLACDGAPPQTQDSEPVTPAAQAAAPEVDATESASSTPEPYDRLELLAERLQQDYLDQLNGQLGDGRPGFSMPDVVLLSSTGRRLCRTDFSSNSNAASPCGKTG
jgi:hypothetical protein